MSPLATLLNANQEIGGPGIPICGRDFRRVQFSMASPVQLAVLNPGGNDREQSFPERAGAPDGGAPHPPVNYHAYAACTGGTFYRDAARIPPAQREVLLVLRRDLKACLKALRELKGERAAGCRVAEGKRPSPGRAAPRATRKTSASFGKFARLPAAASPAHRTSLESTAPPGAGTSRFIPTPYPVDSEKWNFAPPSRGTRRHLHRHARMGHPLAQSRRRPAAGREPRRAGDGDQRGWPRGAQTPRRHRHREPASHRRPAALRGIPAPDRPPPDRPATGPQRRPRPGGGRCPALRRPLRGRRRGHRAHRLPGLVRLCAGRRGKFAKSPPSCFATMPPAPRTPSAPGSSPSSASPSPPFRGTSPITFPTFRPATAPGRSRAARTAAGSRPRSGYSGSLRRR